MAKPVVHGTSVSAPAKLSSANPGGITALFLASQEVALKARPVSSLYNPPIRPSMGSGDDSIEKMKELFNSANDLLDRFNVIMQNRPGEMTNDDFSVLDSARLV